MNYNEQLKHSYENKINNNIQILQVKLNDNPKDINSIFSLALIAKNTHQYKLSLEFLDTCIKINNFSCKLILHKILNHILLGELETASNIVQEFIRKHSLFDFKSCKDIFVELSKLSSNILLDYKSANKLTSLSIEYFPNYYRGYERLALNKMYLYAEFYEGRSILRRLITNYKEPSLIESYLLSFLRDDPQKGLKELKKLKKQTDHKNFLKTIEYKFISTLYDKDKIIKFIDKCSFINKEYAKINLGVLSNDHLDLKQIKQKYIDAEFNYNLNADFEKRVMHYYDFQCYGFVLSKKMEFEKRIMEEIRILNYIKNAAFKKKYLSPPSKARILKYNMPLYRHKKQIKFMSKNNLTKFRNSTVSPIFIIGLPRSGSTLVQKIICNSYSIFCCEESSLINMFLNKTDVSDVKESLYKLYCRNFNSLNEFPTFCDKTLPNFTYMDLIIDIFPKAKFIHSTRDIKENIIAIFKQNFSELPWSFHLENILEYVDQYFILMKKQKKKYKDITFEINHSMLVKNEKIEISKLFNFLDIKNKKKPSESKEKNFFSLTASKHQIKEVVSKKYLSKYKDYYKILDIYKKKYEWLK